MLPARFVLLAALLAGGGVSGSLTAADPAPLTVEQYKPLPYPKGEAPKPALTFDEIAAGARRLESVAGGYPPRLKDDAERNQVYAAWSRLVLAGEALRKKQGDSEPLLVLLIGLYRQGHNLDVMGAAQFAMADLKTALAAYPNSIAVNRQAGYFFLQINPKYARDGERALLRLRQLLHTDRDPEVERGLLFAYIYENRIDDAKKQAAKCVELRPADAEIKGIADGLQHGRIGPRSN